MSRSGAGAAAARPGGASPYLALLSSRLRTLLQYRAAALAGAATQVFFGIVRLSILRAFYRSARAAPPMPIEDVADYVWLGQVCFALLPWRMDMDLVRTFRSGKVAYELLRPVELWTFWWSRHVALLLAPTMLRCVPVILVAGPLLGDLGPPASPAALLAFAVALAGAVVLGAAMITTVSTTLFWTVAGEGAAALHTGLFFLLSGMIVPLPLFPEWSRPVVERLPYAQLVDAPFRLYTGHMAPVEVLGVLGLQALWLLLLWGLGRALLSRGLRKAVIQGG